MLVTGNELWIKEIYLYRHTKNKKMGKNSKIPTPILKINSTTNEIVAEYPRVLDVLKNNNMCYYTLRRLLCTGDNSNGFIYKVNSPLPESIMKWKNKRVLQQGEEHKPHWEGIQPWEGNDGFFDIFGWGKMY